jgi:hypothetical protein
VQPPSLLFQLPAVRARHRVLLLALNRVRRLVPNSITEPGTECRLVQPPALPSLYRVRRLVQPPAPLLSPLLVPLLAVSELTRHRGFSSTERVSPSAELQFLLSSGTE